MDHDEFARRAEALRARLYRTAYLYLGSEADALEAVDEGDTRPCGLCGSCVSRTFLRPGSPGSC